MKSKIYLSMLLTCVVAQGLSATIIWENDEKIGIGTSNPNYKLEVDGSYSASNTGVYSEDYSVPGNTSLSVNWKESTTALDVNMSYRVMAMTKGTDSKTGTMYVVYYDSPTSSWKSRLVSHSNTNHGSNHPEIEVESSTIKVSHKHSSTYAIRVIVEHIQTGDKDVTAHIFGSDYMWVRDANNLSYDEGNVSIGSNLDVAGDLSVDGSVSGHLDVEGKIITSGYGGTGNHLTFKSTHSDGHQYEFYGDSPETGDLGIFDRTAYRRVMAWKADGDVEINNNLEIGVGSSAEGHRLKVEATSFPSNGSPNTTFRSGTDTPLTERYVSLEQSFTGASFDSPALIFRANANANNDSVYGAMNLKSDGDFTLLTTTAQNSSVPSGLTERFRVTNEGYVGIGTKSPEANLQIGSGTKHGMITLGGGKGYAGIGATRSDGGLLLGKNVYARYEDTSDNLYGRVGGDSSYGFTGIKLGSHGQIDFFGKKGSVEADTLANTDENIKMTIGTDGKVGIGLNSPEYELHVDGTVKADQFLVTNAEWADYVFKKGYPLKPLDEVNAYIKAKKHLPNVPSEFEIKRDGLDLSEMQKIHMEKIEEAFLYILQLHARVNNQDIELKNQKDQITKLQKQVEKLMSKN